MKARTFIPTSATLNNTIILIHFPTSGPAPPPYIVSGISLFCSYSFVHRHQGAVQVFVFPSPDYLWKCFLFFLHYLAAGLHWLNLMGSERSRVVGGVDKRESERKEQKEKLNL